MRRLSGGAHVGRGRHRRYAAHQKEPPGDGSQVQLHGVSAVQPVSQHDGAGQPDARAHQATKEEQGGGDRDRHRCAQARRHGT